MDAEVRQILTRQLPGHTATLQQILEQHATLEDAPLSEPDRRKLIATLKDWRAAVRLDPSTGVIPFRGGCHADVSCCFV